MDTLRAAPTAAEREDLQARIDRAVHTRRLGESRREQIRAVLSGVNRPVAVAYAFLTLLLVGYVISEFARGSGQTWPLVDYWAVAFFEIAGSLLCLGKAVSGGRTRPVPLFLGLGLFAWSTGDVVIAIASGRSAGTPALANALYLCFYPLTYVGVMLLVRRQVRRFNIGTWLDGAIAGLGAAALCAAFVFHGVLRTAHGPEGAVAANLAFPVGDLLLLFLVVGGSAVLPMRRRLPWLMLAAGYATNAVGDTFNLFGSGIGATHLGVILNAIAWPTSILLVSGSVWVRTPSGQTAIRDAEPGFLMPGVAAAAALVILFAGSETHIGRAALILAAMTSVSAAVRFWLSLKSLRTLTRERHAQAVTDQLTALSNRRALFELLDDLAFERRNDEEAQPRQLAFLFVDLDRFKEVNDTFGHSVGDELLRQLGQRLRIALRSSDLLVRLGGDEFAVALLDVGVEYGTLVAQRISARLEEPFQLGPMRARVSASIGIATMPEHAEEASDLLHCADVAMYRAKSEGKPFAVYSTELDGNGNRIGLVEDLKRAIETRELELHYQPQIDVGTGEVSSLEALVRWTHPRIGPIPPLEFLPLAEDAELMDQLTPLVLDMALEQCARWRVEGHDVRIAVNISPSNLLDDRFPRVVKRLVTRHRVAPEHVVLEVTETTAISDFNRSKQAIEELRGFGMTVSVDDFGAGFTSLAYLSSLAVSELKLDRSFIYGLAASDDERNRSLVRSTIEMAHALGLRVVAEGVEDEASFELLADLDCDLAQGYLISRPRPAGDLPLTRYEGTAAPALLIGDGTTPDEPTGQSPSVLL